MYYKMCFIENAYLIWKLKVTILYFELDNIRPAFEITSIPCS